MQLSTATRSAVCNAIDDTVNAGAAPEIRFYTTGGATPATEVATIVLNATNVWNNSTDGTMTLNGTGLQDTTPTGGTTAAAAIYADTADTAAAWEVQFGVATATGADITMSNTTVGTGDTVELTQLTISCPAGSNVLS